METLQIKRKREEAEKVLTIFYPQSTRKHPKNEFPLNVIEICFMCEENHSACWGLYKICRHKPIRNTNPLCCNI